MMDLFKRNGFAMRMTVHGCRACFGTWTDECTDADEAVKELCLAHHVGDKAQRAYVHGELLAKRRQLMHAWGDYYLGLGTGESHDPESAPDDSSPEGDPNPSLTIC